MPGKGIKSITVHYKDGGTKDYSATGYDVKNYNFKSGKEPALYIFKGKGKPAIKLKLKNIKTWVTNN